MHIALLFLLKTDLKTGGLLYGTVEGNKVRRIRLPEQTIYCTSLCLSWTNYPSLWTNLAQWYLKINVMTFTMQSCLLHFYTLPFIQYCKALFIFTCKCSILYLACRTSLYFALTDVCFHQLLSGWGDTVKETYLWVIITFFLIKQFISRCAWTHFVHPNGLGGFNHIKHIIIQSS